MHGIMTAMQRSVAGYLGRTNVTLGARAPRHDDYANQN